MIFFTLASLIPFITVVIGMTVNTPTDVVECEPTLLTWQDGTPPYFLSLIPGGQVSSPAIKSFGEQTGTSYSWNVDLQAGTSFTVSLKDSTGLQAYSDIVTISAGSTSCVNTAVTEGTGSATGPVGSTATGSTSSTSPTSSATAKSKSNAASSRYSGTFGIAGFLGIVGMALL